jgi:predicted secreted protein
MTNTNAHRAVGALIIIPTAIFASSARADLAPPQPAVTPVTITATADDTAGDASIGVGEHLLVRLPGSAGTGYSWRIAGDVGPELALVTQHIEPRGTRLLGGAQMYAFEFEGQAAGQKELTFAYVAPGAATEAPPVKTYVLSVTVNE